MRNDDDWDDYLVEPSNFDSDAEAEEEYEEEYEEEDEEYEEEDEEYEYEYEYEEEEDESGAGRPWGLIAACVGGGLFVTLILVLSGIIILRSMRPDGPGTDASLSAGGVTLAPAAAAPATQPGDSRAQALYKVFRSVTTGSNPRLMDIGLKDLQNREIERAKYARQVDRSWMGIPPDEFNPYAINLDLSVVNLYLHQSNSVNSSQFRGHAIRLRPGLLVTDNKFNEGVEIWVLLRDRSEFVLSRATLVKVVNEDSPFPFSFFTFADPFPPPVLSAGTDCRKGDRLISFPGLADYNLVRTVIEVQPDPDKPDYQESVGDGIAVNLSRKQIGFGEIYIKTDSKNDLVYMPDASVWPEAPNPVSMPARTAPGGGKVHPDWLAPLPVKSAQELAAAAKAQTGFRTPMTPKGTLHLRPGLLRELWSETRAKYLEGSIPLDGPEGLRYYFVNELGLFEQASGVTDHVPGLGEAARFLPQPSPAMVIGHLTVFPSGERYLLGNGMSSGNPPTGIANDKGLWGITPVAQGFPTILEFNGGVLCIFKPIASDPGFQQPPPAIPFAGMQEVPRSSGSKILSPLDKDHILSHRGFHTEIINIRSFERTRLFTPEMRKSHWNHTVSLRDGEILSMMSFPDYSKAFVQDLSGKVLRESAAYPSKSLGHYPGLLSEDGRSYFCAPPQNGGSFAIIDVDTLELLAGPLKVNRVGFNLKEGKLYLHVDFDGLKVYNTRGKLLEESETGFKALRPQLQFYDQNFRLSWEEGCALSEEEPWSLSANGKTVEVPYRPSCWIWPSTASPIPELIVGSGKENVVIFPKP